MTATAPPQPRMQPLIDDGVIDVVLHSLTSGKEASVYVVSARGEGVPAE